MRIQGGQAMDSAPEGGPAKPRIIVGGIQSGPGVAPTPAVILSFPDGEEALKAAKDLLALQNGVKPFATGPDVFVGDTNIKVEFWTKGKGRSVETQCVVWAKADKRHLTCSFYMQSPVTQDMVKIFQDLMEVQRSYALNVAWGDKVLPTALDIVKYTLEERRIHD